MEGRIADYNSTASEINDYYSGISISVNGEYDPYVTMETLESYIVNPLPNKTSSFNESNWKDMYFC